MKKRIFSTVVSLLIIISIIGGSKIAYAQGIKKKFSVVNRAISLDKKLGVIHLNEVDSVGIAWINGRAFTTGVIEFDVKGKDEFQGSFVGIAFHGLNDTTYESVYFRPFNFRATDLVRKAHSVQYIANPKYDWLKLRANFPNKYEQPVSSTLDPNQWFHVKIIVSADRVSVYVNEADRPVLEVQPLVHTRGRMIGYWVGNGSGGDWRNLKIISK